jgi:hypothetical protein
MHPMYVRPEGRGIESVRIFYPSDTLYIHIMRARFLYYFYCFM